MLPVVFVDVFVVGAEARLVPLTTVFSIKKWKVDAVDEIHEDEYGRRYTASGT